MGFLRQLIGEVTMDLGELNQYSWDMVARAYLVLIILAPIALGLFYYMGRRGFSSDPWRAQIYRHGPRLRACTMVVDSLMRDGGGQLAIPDYSGVPQAEFLVRMRRAGLIEDAHRRAGSRSTCYRATTGARRCWFRRSTAPRQSTDTSLTHERGSSCAAPASRA
jgi:hypothetical protein